MIAAAHIKGMSTIRRKDLGLQATPAGGNSGSYASQVRPAAQMRASHGAHPLQQAIVDNWPAHITDQGPGYGDTSPWGTITDIDYGGDGIRLVSTASHGGTWVPPELNRLIPEPLRKRNGWYEEDCEARIPAFFFAQQHLAVYPGNTLEEFSAFSMEGVKYWFPEQWEQASGEKVSAAESPKVKQREFEAAHADTPIEVGIARPEGHPNIVLVEATRPADGKTGTFVVPKEEVSSGGGRFLPDPARHPVLPDPEPVESIRCTEIDPSITEAQRRRANKELGELRRFPDGSIRSLRNLIEEEGVTSKTAQVDAGGRTTYLLRFSDGGSYDISASTFAALSHVPDERTPSDFARQAYWREVSRGDKLRAHLRSERNLDAAKQQLREQEAREQALEAEYRRLFEAERGDRQTAHQARQAALAARIDRATLQPDW